MDSPKTATSPSSDELVRRVLEGVVERTLAFAFGAREDVEVQPSPDGLASRLNGVTVTLTTLSDRRPALWAIPTDTWEHWCAAWSQTLGPGKDVAEKSLMLLLTGGLDRWQLLMGEATELPGFPYPGRWEERSAEGWLRLQSAWHWFSVTTLGHQAWIGLSKDMMGVGPRLLKDAAFRVRLREEVLGEACGRRGAERPWEPASRGALELKDDFVLGPCLLPVFGEGEQALVPRFLRADPDAVELEKDELLIQHEFGWDGQIHHVLYRPSARLSRKDLAELMSELAGRLLPFAALAARPAGPESWELIAAGLDSTRRGLRIGAHHIPGGPKWDIFLPAELLNALATVGTRPWSWSWLSAGPENLLRVFLQINDRFRLEPPPGFGDRSGLDWSVGWYAQTGQNDAPAVSLMVADLLAVASAEDKKRIVQNVLVNEAALQPLQGLFTWVEDGSAATTPYQLAGFDRAGFRLLLSGQARDAWDAGGMVTQTHEALRHRNRAALEALWSACSQGSLVLSLPAVELLQVGYADVQKSWRERRARERTGRGLGPVLTQQRARKDLGAILQRPGPRSLALALLFDANASEQVAQLCTRRFADEFDQHQKLWRQSFEASGPELAMFIQALERVEGELTPPAPGET